MLRKLISFLLSISVVASAADPTKGSKLAKGLSDYLPNFAEFNLVVSMANVYMQASSLIRAVNASVTSMQQATDKLGDAKNAADAIWGDVKKLENVNIYDMDSWSTGLHVLSNDVINADLMQTNQLLTSAALDFGNGTMGGYIKAANGLSYDARQGGVDYAFKAYYEQADWSDYKASHNLAAQDQQTQDKLNNIEVLREQKSALKEWVCPQGYTPTQCANMQQQNQIQVAALDQQIQGINDDIDKMTSAIVVDRLKDNEGVMRLEYLEKAVQKAHLSVDDYNQAYNQINQTAALLARKAMRYVSGRVTSGSRNPKPRPAADLTPADVQQLCARSENLIVQADGSLTCVYASTKDAAGKWVPDNNSTGTPTDTYDPTDLTDNDPGNETPRDVTASDLQKIKTEIAFVNLEQEQLLLDIELDNSLLNVALLSHRSAQAMDHRRKLRSEREALGMAAAVASINGRSADEIRSRHNQNFVSKPSWDMNDDFATNLSR